MGSVIVALDLVSVLPRQLSDLNHFEFTLVMKATETTANIVSLTREMNPGVLSTYRRCENVAFIELQQTTIT